MSESRLGSWRTLTAVARVPPHVADATNHLWGHPRVCRTAQHQNCAEYAIRNTPNTVQLLKTYTNPYACRACASIDVPKRHPSVHSNQKSLPATAVNEANEL